MSDHDDDPLLTALRELPVQTPPARTHAVARRAYAGAFERSRGGVAGRALVPTLLVSVVGSYLFWAFATAIAINQ